MPTIDIRIFVNVDSDDIRLRNIIRGTMSLDIPQELFDRLEADEEGGDAEAWTTLDGVISHRVPRKLFNAMKVESWEIID